MSCKLKYISLAQALEYVKQISSLRGISRKVPLNEALGEVLAEDVVSDADFPPRDVSHFDGYAIKSIETKNASPNDPAEFKLVAKIFPGEDRKLSIRNGEAAYVATGSYLPDGADSVAPVEVTRLEGHKLLVFKKIKMGEHVIARGSDVSKGEIVLRKGRMIKVQDLVLLGRIHKWTIKTFRRPSISVVSVGDELTENIREVEQGKLYDTHKVFILRLIELFGGTPKDLGIVPDEAQEILKAIKNGLEKSDIVVTIGSSSKGEKDHLPRIIGSMSNAKFLFRGVRIQPGRMTGLAIVKEKPLVMLPGNIQSTFAGAYFVLQPLIRYMMGLPPFIFSFDIKAKLLNEIDFRPYVLFQKIRFIKLRKAEKEFYAEPLTSESWLVNAMVKANGIILVPEGIKKLSKGEEVIVKIVPNIFEPETYQQEF